jgi:hypothetical protein
LLRSLLLPEALPPVRLAAPLLQTLLLRLLRSDLRLRTGLCRGPELRLRTELRLRFVLRTLLLPEALPPVRLAAPLLQTPLLRLLL